MKFVVILAIFVTFCLVILLQREPGIPPNIQVRIDRDQFGIPHIFAYNKAEVMFGLGFAQAQDRLWTLMIKKKFIQGRLAEVFGEEALPSDLYIRNFNFNQVGITNTQYLDQETRHLFQSYADGINYYEKSVKMLPFQFYLTGTKWQKWEIKDSLALLAFFSFNLEFDWMYEIARQRLLEVVGFDLARKMFSFGGTEQFKNITIMNQQEIRKIGRYKQYDYKK